MKKLFLFASLSLCIFVSPATASDYYTQTRLNTLYDQTGESTSTLKVTLRNLTSQNYPSSFKVNIHGDKIEFLKAQDDYGDLNYFYNYQPTGINSIEVKFNRRMVGKDVLTHLNFTFKNPKAERTENTWVVFFPKIALAEPGDYQYSLSIPKSFGRLIAAETIPEIKNKSPTEDLYLLKGQNLPTSNRLIFGDSYPYKFTLNFSHTNQVTLPKDTSSQKIYITAIIPSPSEVVLSNNSWLAKYQKNQDKITVHGFAIYFNANDKMTNDNLVEFESHPYQYLPAKTINISLSPPKYFWPLIDNKLTLNIKNPNFQALYNVTLNLSATGMLVSSNPTISAIPPAGSINLPIKLQLHNLFTSKSLTISTPGLKFSYNPTKNSLLFYYLIYCVFLSFILIITVYFAHLTWRLFLQRQKQKNNLRW